MTDTEPIDLDAQIAAVLRACNVSDADIEYGVHGMRAILSSQAPATRWKYSPREHTTGVIEPPTLTSEAKS